MIVWKISEIQQSHTASHTHSITKQHSITPFNRAQFIAIVWSYGYVHSIRLSRRIYVSVYVSASNNWFMWNYTTPIKMVLHGPTRNGTSSPSVAEPRFEHVSLAGYHWLASWLEQWTIAACLKHWHNSTINTIDV